MFSIFCGKKPNTQNNIPRKSHVIPLITTKTMTLFGVFIELPSYKCRAFVDCLCHIGHGFSEYSLTLFDSEINYCG